jgi:hypothetical protein
LIFAARIDRFWSALPELELQIADGASFGEWRNICPARKRDVPVGVVRAPA